MTRTITLALTETEMQLLRKFAALGCRRPQEQARYFLRAALVKELEPYSAYSPEMATDLIKQLEDYNAKNGFIDEVEKADNR